MTTKRQIQSRIDTNKNTLTIAVEGKESIVVGLDTLAPEMLHHAALHGLKQKIVDAAALGSGYTISEKYEAMVEVFERVTGPEPSWNKRATGGGGATGLLFRALCRMYPEKDSADIRAYHDGLDKKQQAALRKHPSIAVIIEEIKAESTDTSGIDSDELLAGLEG